MGDGRRLKPIAKRATGFRTATALSTLYRRRIGRNLLSTRPPWVSVVSHEPVLVFVWTALM